MKNIDNLIKNLSPEKKLKLEKLLEEKNKNKKIPSIKSVEKRKFYPLSGAQKRMFILNRMSNDSTVYNMPAAFIIDGELEKDHFEEVFKKIVNRHEAFRTRFEIINGEPVQIVEETLDFKVKYFEIKEEEIFDLTRDYLKPFDISKAPILRVEVGKINNSKYAMFINMHHIISDGVSINIFIKDFISLYKHENLPELKIQYKDFTIWQEELNEEMIYKKQDKYWLEKFKNEIPILNLPLDFPRSEIQSHEGDKLTFRIEKKYLESINKIMKETDTTLFMVLLAGFYILLYKYTGQKDIVIGSPIAGRLHVELENVIGMFVNTLVLRNYPKGEKSFLEFLNEVKESAFGAYDNQDYPFDNLVEKLNVKRDMSRNPVFDVMFIMQNMKEQELNIKDLKIKKMPLNNKTSMFDLLLTAVETENGISFELNYCIKLFKKETIEKLGYHYSNILKRISSHPNKKINEIEILSEEEKNNILHHFNNTKAEYPEEKTIIDLFEEQVEKTPDNVAVIFEDEKTTYSELNKKANKLANYLKENGVCEGKTVGIYLTRSINTVISLLGILKAGGTYLPLDPGFPKKRTLFMIEDSAPFMVVTEKELEENLSGKHSMFFMDKQFDLLKAYDGNIPEKISNKENIAYIIYTSGSTGNPKGVCIPHKALTNFLCSMKELPGISSKDRFISVTTLSFDIAGMEIYLPLICGACVVLANKEETVDGNKLIRLIKEQKGTVMQATPATWRLLIESGWEGNKNIKILCGGEALSKDLAVQLSKKGKQIWNMYGPTETTIWSCIHQIKKEDDKILIGRPINNTEIYILDEYLQPVPIGVTGELYIGGDGVAAGYHNKLELTKEKFVSNPFNKNTVDKMYRTGDLGRWLFDGSIECHGRIDNQVKIRGFRIELEEIENQLFKYKDITNCVVIAKNIQEDKYIFAYYISSKEIPVSELREYLSGILPEYMIPSYFIKIEEMPLNTNGKIDRKALPESDGIINTGNEYIAPTNMVEKKLMKIWQEVLKVEKIGINDSFFELGGHSLLAIKLISKIKEDFNIEIPLQILFQTKTISGIGSYLGKNKSNDKESILAKLPLIIPDLENKNKPFPLTDIQQAYWVGQTNKFGLGGVGCHVYIEIKTKDIDLFRFNLALQRLIERHDMLRAVILPDGTQKILEKVTPYQIQVIDLKNQNNSIEIEQNLNETREIMSHQFFNPERWPLFDFRITLLKGNIIYFHISLDILIMDATSIRKLMFELNEIYFNQEIVLPPLEISFRDYVLAEIDFRSSETYKQAMKYWLDRLRDFPSAPELSIIKSKSNMKNPKFIRLEKILNKEQWGKIKNRAISYGLTPTGILLAAFSEILTAWSKTDHYIINLTLFRRLQFHPQVNDLIGDFTSTSLLEVNHSTGDDFITRAKNLQIQLWTDLNYSYFSGVQVLRELGRISGINQQIIMPVVFTSTLTDDIGNEKRMNIWGESEQVYGITQTPQVWLDHQVSEQDGELFFSWDSIEGLFPENMVDDMFNTYYKLIEALAEDENKWKEDNVVFMPESHRILYENINNTKSIESDELLHTMFMKKAQEQPDSLAVITKNNSITYKELDELSNSSGWMLKEAGIRSNTLVAIVMEKGWEQIAGVLGILKAGGAYLPIDAKLPLERIITIIEQAKVSIVLIQPKMMLNFRFPETIKIIPVVYEINEKVSNKSLGSPVQNKEDLAYVIYTSGSTGMPKGVMIDHKGAVNTILDINSRFNVTNNDKVLAVSSLSFDLSVYDIFGILSAGGTIVIPDSDNANSPQNWFNMLSKFQVTIWNSVPALMDILVETVQMGNLILPNSLRLVLLSGDWIPVNLSEKIKSLNDQVEVISLGGATEASIWSILYPIKKVESYWQSIPYGKPMLNQSFYVLDKKFRERPIHVQGDLYIGGIGLAKGYLYDKEKTDDKFILHPVTNERLYMTGDMGRYLPDGNIEFLGREDAQVKIRGYRIELGEIEAAIFKNPDVEKNIVTVAGERFGEKNLVAYIVIKKGKSLSKEELREFLSLKLPNYMIPNIFMFVDDFKLTFNGKIDRNSLPLPEQYVEKDAKIENKEEQVVKIKEDNEIIEKIKNIIKEVTRIDNIEIDTNLIASGVNSVELIRISNLLVKEMNFTPKIEEIFMKPTIAQIYKLYKEQNGIISVSKEANETHSQVIMDPDERKIFKEHEYNLRNFQSKENSIKLGKNNKYDNEYLKYFSSRKFSKEIISIEQFGNFISCLNQKRINDKPKYLYASAGGAYPVQTYLYIKENRIENIRQGIYYYHPKEAGLYSISTDLIDSEIHEYFINRPIFEESAFSIFFIAQLNSIEPLYGDRSLDFCKLEAGLMAQLLSSKAFENQIGLCQVGTIDFKKIEHLFLLDDAQELIHSILGGKLIESEKENRLSKGENYFTINDQKDVGII